MASYKSSGKSGKSRSVAGKSRTSAKKAATRSRGRSSRRSDGRWRDVTGLASIALGSYLAGMLWFGWDGGQLGNILTAASQLLVGHAAYIFPVLATAIGVLVVVRSGLIEPGPFRAGLYVLVPGILLAFGGDRLYLGDGSAPSSGLTPDVVADHGGYIGGVLYAASFTLFGDAGTTIVCLLAISLGILFVSGSSLQAGTRWWARRIGTAAVTAGHASVHVATRIGEVTADHIAQARALAEARAREQHGPFDVTAFPDIFGDIPPDLARATAVGSAPGSIEVESPEPARKRSRKRRPEPTDADDQLALLEPVVADDDGSGVDDTAEIPASEPAVPTRRSREAASETILRARVSDAYNLPSPKLLKAARRPTEVKQSEVDRIGRLLVETFGHFGIEARMAGHVPGPRVTRYELSLAPGTKMSKVENLRKDLAYALATTEIRILAPIPGKSAVGIEVENATPAIVTLGDIWFDRPEKSSPLHVLLGKDITGDVVAADLAEMPHLLVAGTTGAGKSGCMNAMLSSIVLGSSPDEVRMLLIDPKKVELSTYEGLPHLLTPVVTNMKKASNALGNVVSQMEERYASMEIAGARTLPEYNRIRMARGDDPVPYILVVIDELADLVMQAKSDVEDAVIRVAQKGRAAGFHLVLATQRPSVDVITGMIKSNVPSRIAFAVSAQTDSRVILDQNGAETLLGKGDMLFKPVSKRTPQRVQGAWISESEVRAICDAARSQREPEYDSDLLAEPEAPAADGDAGFVDSDDRLAEAIRLVAEFQTCSASFFQRRMRVGYTRGARLVDMLERRGIVAPGEGPRPRTVLITDDDVPRLLEEFTDEMLGSAAGGVSTESST